MVPAPASGGPQCWVFGNQRAYVGEKYGTGSEDQWPAPPNVSPRTAFVIRGAPNAGLLAQEE